MAHVADGDTLTALTARGPMRVRLLGIDAPRLTGTRFGHPTCRGRSAAGDLRALAPPGTSVRLVTDPASGDTYDAYHRLLAYVVGPHGDLGEAQLAAGEAIVYRYRGRRFSRLAAYLRAERAGARTRPRRLALVPGRFPPPGGVRRRSMSAPGHHPLRRFGRAAMDRGGDRVLPRRAAVELRGDPRAATAVRLPRPPRERPRSGEHGRALVSGVQGDLAPAI